MLYSWISVFLSELEISSKKRPPLSVAYQEQSTRKKRGKGKEGFKAQEQSKRGGSREEGIRLKGEEKILEVE